MNRRTLVVISLGIVVSLALVTLTIAYTPIKYGYVGVVTKFGEVTGETWGPGLHWKTPFVERIVKYATIVKSYETGDHPEDSNADFTDYAISAQTIDGQQITVKTTTIFLVRGEDAEDVLANIGKMDIVVENVVKAHTRNLARLWAQNYTAEELYSGEGVFAYERIVAEALQAKFSEHRVTLSDFLVRKISFDEDYITAIEQQQIAEEAIETARYQADAAEYTKQERIRDAEAQARSAELQADAEAYRQVTLAQSEAEKKRILADANAYEIVTVADAEASAMQVKGTQLARYPELVQWRFVESLSGVQWGILPDDVLIPLTDAVSRLTAPE